MDFEYDCNELAEMDDEQLRRLLRDLSGDEEFMDLDSLDRQELLDIIVAEYATDCYDQLHSAARDLDYDEDEDEDDDYDGDEDFDVDMDDERA